MHMITYKKSNKTQGLKLLLIIDLISNLLLSDNHIPQGRDMKIQFLR